MKNFLANKHNVPVSAYITDLNPTQITTNGALTIIDNSDPNPNNHIYGLVPNSYCIFLDNLFLASGYGFSSYNHFEKASYIINTYEGVITYIGDEINDLRNKTFNIEYSYENSENKIDHVYNTYGWLKQYKEIDVYKSPENNSTYIIQLKTIHTPYISDIQLELIGGKDIYGHNDNNSTDLIYNYFDVNNSSHVQLSFTITDNSIIANSQNGENDNISIKEKIIQNAPNLYINDEIVDFNKFEESGQLLTYYIDYENINSEYNTKDLSLVCKRDNDIVYSYTFNNLIKWRYKILPFNTEYINALSQLELSTIMAFDNYEFSDTGFDIQNISNDTDDNLTILNKLKSFIENNENSMVYLDDNTEIEFNGTGYKANNSIFFTHDYILVKYNTIKIDFYFNNIKNNNWNYIELNNDNNEIFRLYQSPRRYIGKHKWIIKYNYE